MTAIVPRHPTTSDPTPVGLTTCCGMLGAVLRVAVMRAHAPRQGL